MGKNRVYIILSVLFYLLYSAGAVPVFDVVKLGAHPDGRTDSTKSFMNAWAGACASVGSAKIYVSSGTYLTKNLVFNGPCKNTDITFQIDGTLVAPSDYKVMSHSENWISFKNVVGVSLYGGTLDGRGTALWACKHSHRNCPPGATTLSFLNSKHIRLNRLKSLNSQMFHIVINGCEDVDMQGVKITASGQSPNTDGIHVQMSKGVTIMSSTIQTGDDCISIGPGAKNLWIQHIECGPGHDISIGSLGKSFNEQGVQNVTVKTSTFTGTQNGLRIKSWARPSNGFVRQILFQNSIMKDVQNPLLIDQNYCPHGEGCPNKESGVKISQVTYRDIQGTSSTKVAVKFDCSRKNPCTDINLENVRLTYRNEQAISACTNADGYVNGVVQPAGCLN